MSAEIPDRDHIQALRKSIDVVGCLTELVVDETNGQTLSGTHRQLAFPNCPKRLVKSDSPLHAALINVNLNIQRQVPEKVTAHKLLNIAKILSTTGGKVNGKVIEPVAKEDVCEKICELVPLTPQWIRKCLPDEYKHMEKSVRVSSEKVLSHDDMTEKVNAVREVTTALTIQKPAIEDDPRPFKDCRCNECSHFGKDC